MQVESDTWLEIIRFHLDHVKRQQLAKTCKTLHHGVNSYYAKLTHDVRHRKKTIGELYDEKFFDIRKVFELDLRRRCASVQEFYDRNYFRENDIYPRHTEAGFRLVYGRTLKEVGHTGERTMACKPGLYFCKWRVLSHL